MEDRDRLLEAANSLRDEVAKPIKELLHKVNLVTAALEGARDSLALTAADEKEEQQNVRKKNVTYSTPLDFDPSKLRMSDKPVKSEKETYVAPHKVDSGLGPGKRACSLCRKPGHRAKNCPQRD